MVNWVPDQVREDVEGVATVGVSRFTKPRPTFNVIPTEENWIPLNLVAKLYSFSSVTPLKNGAQVTSKQELHLGDAQALSKTNFSNEL